MRRIRPSLGSPPAQPDDHTVDRAVEEAVVRLLRAPARLQPAVRVLRVRRLRRRRPVLRAVYSGTLPRRCAKEPGGTLLGATEKAQCAQLVHDEGAVLARY